MATVANEAVAASMATLLPMDEPEPEPLVADLVATLGWEREDARRIVAQSISPGGGPPPGLVSVTEGVQQWLHDTLLDAFLDTGWPACPDHPAHPLRVEGEGALWWTCPQSGKHVCRLGDLGTISSVNEPTPAWNRERLAAKEEQPTGARPNSRREPSGPCSTAPWAKGSSI
ncbi:MAG: hypothetical protein ACRDJU_06360 [Actinomycetota bacterium]